MRRSITILTLVALTALVSCDGGDDPDEPTETPSASQAGTPGAIRTPPASPGAPENTDALAQTVATALAAIYANDDANTGAKYTEDVLKTTGCSVEESTVAYKESSKALEHRARVELIEDLKSNDQVTAFAHATAPTTKDIEPTIGDKKGNADFVGIVVALFCQS